MCKIDFTGNPEIELIYRAMMQLPCYSKYYEVACFHRSIDVLLVHPLGTIIAIEAKISDWKKAIHQASTYQLIADYVFILMPQKKKLNHKLSMKLDKYGIGLMLLGSDDKLHVVKEPEKSKLIFGPARKRLEKRITEKNLDTVSPWERISSAHV